MATMIFLLLEYFELDLLYPTNIAKIFVMADESKISATIAEVIDKNKDVHPGKELKLAGQYFFSQDFILKATQEILTKVDHNIYLILVEQGYPFKKSKVFYASAVAKDVDSALDVIREEYCPLDPNNPDCRSDVRLIKAYLVPILWTFNNGVISTRTYI